MLQVLHADWQSMHMLVSNLVLSPFIMRCSSMLPTANCLHTLQIAQRESCSMSPLQICHKLQSMFCVKPLVHSSCLPYRC